MHDEDTDTWQTLAAATAKLLEKQQPDSDGAPDKGERTSQTEQREAQRAKFKVSRI